jgi:signal transduction histidine kinase/CheY-like chemotaxis protein
MEGSPLDATVWRPALEKYATVTHLTVILYDDDGHIACDPINPTALFEALAHAPSDPGLFQECADRCVSGQQNASTITVAKRSGLAVVGTPLALNGRMVGAAIAGYHLVDFPQTVAIERLAHDSGIAMGPLWDIVQRETPVSRSRFIVEGELLQVLCDTILRETDAAAAKDEFLAVLSHELRTPLTPILGWARMLKLGDDPARIERAATIIERNALLQSKLVDDLLELTRVTRGKVTLDLRVSDLSDAIRSAVDVYLDAATQKRVALQVLEAGEPLLVNADTNRLQQIFRNVLANALKFTDAGGSITVTLSNVAGTGVVKIRDTGEGISPAFLPFVFDIFRQQEQGTRRRHEGLGIGLALVKRLTELQGGDVTLASGGVGQGTEATIQFPLAAESDGGLAAVPPVTERGLRELHGLRLLVVEDNDDAREATRLILEGLGADVLVARDGVEALEIVAAAEPDVVLCDLRMPRMDGFEFIRALHHKPDILSPPVIAISGLASREDHRRTKRAGFEGHLDKPFDDAGLLAAVGAAIGRRR